MADPNIRGNSTSLAIVRNGERTDIGDITNFTFTEVANFAMTYPVGAQHGKGDKVTERWEGRFDLEISDGSIHDFVQREYSENLNGVGISDYVIIHTERYPNGTSRSFAFSDCQFKFSQQGAGKQAKNTYSLDFQASVRQAI